MWGAEGWDMHFNGFTLLVTAVTSERGLGQVGERHVLLHSLPYCMYLCQVNVCSCKSKKGETRLCIGTS